MSFTDRDLKKLVKDEKGYEGECYFDHLIANSPASTSLILDDLLLEWRNNTFQIDSLLISPYKIYLIDVKNIEGEFYIEGNQWFFLSGLEVKNPLIQLQRSDSLLRPMHQSLTVNLPIEAIVIFVNPEFTLVQTSE